MTTPDPALMAPYGEPVTKLADLDALDSDEMVEGYRDGRAGEPEPKGNRSRSYWHGWRNGAVDGKHRESDDAQRLLAHRYVEATKVRKEPPNVR